MVVHLLFDVGQFGRIDRGEVREIEAHPVWRHQRTRLLDVRAQNIAQRRMHEVRRGMVALIAFAARGVRLAGHAIAHAQRLLGLDAMRHEARDWIIGAPHVGYFEGSFVVPERARIGDLAAGFGIERRAVENNFAFRARRQFAGEPFGSDDRLDAAVARARAIVKIRLGAKRFRQFRVSGARDFLVRAFPGGFGPLPLLRHRPVEFCRVEGDALVAQRIRDEIERQPKGIVKAERLLPGIAHPSLRLLLRQQRRQVFFEPAKAHIDGVSEALLFVADHAGNAADAFEQFGIRLAHLLGDLLRHLEKERPLEAKHPPMAHRAANNLAQHVAAAFIGGHDAIADQERRRAAVIGKNSQRRVGLGRRAVMFAGKLAGKIHQRLKKIRLIIADLALQHRGEPLEPRARVDRGLGQQGHVSRCVAIELHENQVPYFDVAAAVAAELTIRVARIRSRGAHVVVDFAARAARTRVSHGPEILLEAGNGNHARFARAHAEPVLGGFFVGRQFFPRSDFCAPEDGEIEFIERNAKPARGRRRN